MSQSPSGSFHHPSQSPCLERSVCAALEHYFSDMQGLEPDHLYERLLLTVERPLLQLTMERTQQNQSVAARWLGLNRNTLRKKLQQHGLLHPGKEQGGSGC